MKQIACCKYANVDYENFGINDINASDADKWFVEDWDSISDGCKNCFLLMFGDSVYISMKMNKHVDKCMSLGEYTSDITDLVEGLHIGCLKEQGKMITGVHLANGDMDPKKTGKMLLVVEETEEGSEEDVEEDSLGGDNAQENTGKKKGKEAKQRKPCMDNKCTTVERYGSRAHERRELIMKNPRLLNDDEKKKKEIALIWYKKAVERINKMRKREATCTKLLKRGRDGDENVGSNWANNSTADSVRLFAKRKQSVVINLVGV